MLLGFVQGPGFVLNSSKEQQHSQQRSDLMYKTGMKSETNRLKTVRQIINLSRSGVGKYGAVTVFELQ